MVSFRLVQVAESFPVHSEAAAQFAVEAVVGHPVHGYLVADLSAHAAESLELIGFVGRKYQDDVGYNFIRFLKFFLI